MKNPCSARSVSKTRIDNKKVKPWLTEQDLEVALLFAPREDTGQLQKAPTIDSSLMLLRQDIAVTPGEDEFNYHIDATDFVRKDWISFETTCNAPMRVLVEARSEDAYDSEYL